MGGESEGDLRRSTREGAPGTSKEGGGGGMDSGMGGGRSKGGGEPSGFGSDSFPNLEDIREFSEIFPADPEIFRTCFFGKGGVGPSEKEGGGAESEGEGEGGFGA
jgi:hypothetical protein